MLIKWEDSKFGIGVEEIDVQHKKLVSMINDLFEAMKSGKGRAVLMNTIRDMLEYAKTHFATEERYMNKLNYPETLKHKKEHESFIKVAEDFYSKLLNESITAIEVMNFLKDWLSNHILRSDKKLGLFINNKT